MSIALAPTRSTAVRREPRRAPRRASAVRRLRLTFGGLLALGVILIVGIAGATQDANLLLLLFGISVGMVLFSAVAPVWMVHKLQIERLLPEAAVAGRPFRIVYILRSRRRWLNSMSLTVGERPASRRSSPQLPQVFIPVLSAGQEQRVEVLATLGHRGRVSLSAVRIASRFPFGLFSCTLDFAQPGEFIVYPALGRFRSDPWKETHSSGSVQRQGFKRGDEEFYGIREYRLGDDIRRVHWRTSARIGRLMVREMIPLQTTQLMLLLDPWPEGTGTVSEPGVPGTGAVSEPGGGVRRFEDGACPPRGGRGRRGGRGQSPSSKRPASPYVSEMGTVPAYASEMGTVPCEMGTFPFDPAVERVISAAATALCDGIEHGHRVGLVCRSAVPIMIPPGAGAQQRQRLLHELALIHPPSRESFEDLLSRVRWPSSWHARCLICVPTAQAAHEQAVRFLSTRSEAVMVLSADDEVFEPALDAPAPIRSRP